MLQSYESIPIERIIRDGIYCKDIQFNQNKDNIRRVIKYLGKLEPQKESLAIAIALLKFYRFPTVICLAPLYSRIDKLGEGQQEEMKQQLQQIAAILSTLLKNMHQDHFKEIAIFFKWGIYKKKKYKFQISNPEIEFASFIVRLSTMKDEIQKLADVKEKKEVKMQKINQFLSLEMKRQLNPFEEYFINYIRKQSETIIWRIQNEEEDFQEKKKEKSSKKDELKNSQDFPSLLKGQESKKDNPYLADITTTSIIKKEEAEIKQEGACEEKKQTQHNKPSTSNEKPINRKPRGNLFYLNECMIEQVEPRLEEKRVTPICCRTFFYADETIEQPESLRIQYKFYNFPFDNKKDQFPTKREKIRRTLCGFLNAEGGTVYFGIKEDLNRQRFINGMFMTENAKVQFRKEIFDLLKDIKPDVGKRCEIKWVPLRSMRDNNYLVGKYVAKVIIERGAKDQVYSYEQPIYNGRFQEKFAFKTENQVLVKTDAQQILKIFKNKNEQPERPFYPIHSYPCKEPEVGKQVIGDDYYRSNEQVGRRRDFFSPRNQGFRGKGRDNLSKQGDKDELGDKLVEQVQQIKQRKKYMQKNCNQFLVKFTSKEDLQIELRKKGYSAVQIKQLSKNPLIFYVKLEKENKPFQSSPNLKLMQIYGRISYRMLIPEHLQLLELILPEYKLSNKEVRNRQDKILLFGSAIEAARFYLRLHEMNIKLKFTPEG